MRLRPALSVLVVLVAAAVVAGVSLGRGSARHAAPALLRGERGHPVLLSFLDTQAEVSASGNPSRSQIVMLKSMQTQSGRYGLKTVIVDAAALLGRPAPSAASLVNFRYDWALPTGVSVRSDEHGALERGYRVTKAPTTLLLDRRGNVVRRWNRFAMAAQLDFAIRRLTGRSMTR